MWRVLRINRLSDSIKISAFLVLLVSMFVLSGVVAESALDSATRVVLQCIFLFNVFAYLYDMTMYGPHLYLKYSGDTVEEQVGRFLFMLVCFSLSVLCILY